VLALLRIEASSSRNVSLLLALSAAKALNFTTGEITGLGAEKNMYAYLVSKTELKDLL
jgi:hypothetical protein